METPEFLGEGRDQANTRDRPYNKLELVSAWRVEHATLWYTYVAEINKMRSDFKRYRNEAPPKRSRGPLALPGLP
jgi:hypothetical protein